MDFHKDEEIMDMPLIIKQVCQQLGLMKVMQRGSGPARGPQRLGVVVVRDGGGLGLWAQGLCLKHGRSNNAVTAILHIVNIEVPV